MGATSLGQKQTVMNYHLQKTVFGNFIKKQVLSGKSLIIFFPFLLALGCSAEKTNMDSSSLFSVTWEKGQPSIEEIRQQYGFEQGEIDSKYGVVEIDPADNLYTVKVNAQAAERFYRNSGQKVSSPNGVFSNPKIEPFNLK